MGNLKTLVLQVNRAELELLRLIGTVEMISGTIVPEEFDVSFAYPYEFGVLIPLPELVEKLEERMAFQESDQGDWLRAQEWRAAKPTLLTKFRRAYLHTIHTIKAGNGED